MAPNSPVINFVNQLYGSLGETTEMKRLKSGFLIREMLERFSQKSESKLHPDRSLWIYSAHDKTIIYLLISLGLFEVYLLIVEFDESNNFGINIKMIFNFSHTFHRFLRAYSLSYTNPKMNIFMLNFFIKIQPQRIFHH